MVPADVAIRQGEAAHRLIPDSRLYAMENAAHLLWISEGAEEMYRTQLEFLQESFATV